MHLRVWLHDLGSAAWLIIVGILSAAFTVAALVSAVQGVHVATPWFVVGALLCLLVIVFTAYAAAAAERDRLRAVPDAGHRQEIQELRETVERLRREQVTIIDNGDGTLAFNVGPGAEPDPR